MTNQLCLQQQYARLYKKMLQQLAGHESMVTDEKKWIEWGFAIIMRTWLSIQQETADYQFADQQEEISFYKTLKPKFIALMDFFTLLYRSALFQPDSKAEKKKYWQRELKNCEIFLQKHQSFCRYYQQGHTGMDHIYFVQLNNQQSFLFGINENSRHAITSYSYLLARIISIKKYQRYVQEKICFLTNCRLRSQN